MTTMTDKRLFERIDGELGLRYTLHNDNREILSAATKNISGGGLRTTLVKKLAPGTLLDLELSIDNGDVKLRFEGKVSWLWDEPMNKEKEELFEAGIQFVNQRLFYVGRLIKYLETNKY